MKKIILIIMAMLTMTSCETFQENFKIEKAPKLINAVVPSAVKIGVKKQPKSAKYLQALVVMLDSFALGEDLSPENLEKVIKTADVKELETPEALSVVSSVVALYKAYYEDAITDKINSIDNLRDILEALSKSISKGLIESGYYDSK